ncbi:MAG: MBG domain-containing protein [Chitinispirillia bacterium]|nr:MBG domain-containing protein [Chitinispirillia bacterium]
MTDEVLFKSALLLKIIHSKKWGFIMDKLVRLITAAVCGAILAAPVMAQTPNTNWFRYTARDTNYTISTADQLAGLARIVNGTWGGSPASWNFSGDTVTLAGEINLSGYAAGGGWTPIGRNGDFSFAGTFNGRGNVIRNLTINRPDSNYQGLFGYIAGFGSNVRNLGLVGVNIVGGGDLGGDLRNYGNVGAVAGYVERGSMVNCYVTGRVEGIINVGGLAGFVVLGGSVVNSYSLADVSGNDRIGGIAGYLSNSSVANCYAAGLIDGNMHVGGIVGDFNSGSVTLCAALNSDVRGNSHTGRIVGGTGVGTLTGNAAFTGMKNKAGDVFWNKEGASDIDGVRITVADIRADNTVGSRFTSANGWTVGNGRLPGLFGAAVDFPSHLETVTDTTVYGVTVSPASESVMGGAVRTVQFTADVRTESTTKTVTWSVSGKTSASTEINTSAGLLAIAADEPAGVLTVTAASVVDSMVSAFASVTVVGVHYGWYLNNSGASNFTVSTAEELAGLADIVNGTWGRSPARDDFSGKTITLANDLDLSLFDNWVPIGDDLGREFRGIFDGGNKVISNLTINRPDSRDAQGLFGNIGPNGVVRNLGLVGVNIVGEEFVGGVVGYVYNGSVVNCYVTGTVAGIGSVGGIVGFLAEGSVTNCYSAGTVTGSHSHIGGIAGIIVRNSSVANCYSISTVSSTGAYPLIGGIVGWGGEEPVFGDGSSVSYCAALNPEVRGAGMPGAADGRVVGEIIGPGVTLANNTAFIGLRNSRGTITWNNTGADKKDGEAISAADLKADGTIGGRFTAGNGWTVEDGKLPGLFGKTVDIPAHLELITTVIDHLNYNIALVDYTGSAQPVTVTAKDGIGLGAITVSYNGSTAVPVNAGTYAVTVSIAQSAAYSAAEFSLGVYFIRRANPDVPPVPEGLTAVFGQTLTSAALPDGWSWMSETASVGNAGEQTHKAEFTPLDTANFNTMPNRDVKVTVAKANPTIPEAPAGLTAAFGQTLAGVTLTNGFTWMDATVSVGGIGEQTHKAKFTPSDIANFNIMENIDVTVTVGKASYNMAGITFADRSVAYNAAEHNILIGGNLPSGVSVSYTGNGQANAGEYQITAVFTVADSATHNIPASMTATLTITKINPAVPSAPAGLAAVFGQTLASIALTDGFAWMDESASVGNAGTQTHQVKFTPPNIINYNVITNINVTVEVARADPIFTAPAGLAAVYGQTLFHVTLTGGWSWMGGTAALLTPVGSAGPQTHKAMFTPSNTANYNVMTDIDVTITVAKANPAVSAVPTGLTAVFGQTLADVVLTGAWSWMDETEEVGSAGPQTHQAKFTPSDIANFNVMTNIDVTVTVGKASYDMSAITFADKSVEYDSAAHSIYISGELPAGVSVSYTGNGQSDIGEYQITAAFTVADAVNYNIPSPMTAKLTIAKTQSVLSHNRIVPNTQPQTDTKDVSQDDALSSQFTAGPNPAARSSGKVDFFRQGKRIDNAVFTIFDASGNAVNKVTVKDNAIGDQSRRLVGSWNLKDTKGRAVAEGTYLVRGVITASDGKRERVSLILGVR